MAKALTFMLVPQDSGLGVSTATPLTRKQIENVSDTVGRFLDVIGTSTARATHYNTKEEQEQAESIIHDAMFKLDRGLYGLLLGLDGTTDHSRQIGVARLLDNPRSDKDKAVLTPELESRLIAWMSNHLPPHRMLKMFMMAKERRINNARTRKCILRMVLGSDRLDMWATKYRRKMRAALTHAWGKKRTSIIRSILAKPDSEWTKKESSILQTNIVKFTNASGKKGLMGIFESVGFILGIERGDFASAKLRSYVGAKTKIEDGRQLSPETLEGIRSVYHKGVPNARVLELTKRQMTSGQKMAKQREAKSKGVDIGGFDPTKQDPVRLYLYAFEMGLDEKVEEALVEKAKRAGAKFPVKFPKVEIIVDASKSMEGNETQPLRPMAVALATRDMLFYASEDPNVRYCGGKGNGSPRMVKPEGDTSLALELVRAFQSKPDAIFMITDGYENAPAGRCDEVIVQARQLGYQTPVYQLSPVMAAESGGVKMLSQGISPMPVSKPEGMGVSLLKGMLNADPLKALSGLTRMAVADMPFVQIPG